MWWEWNRKADFRAARKAGIGFLLRGLSCFTFTSLFLSQSHDGFHAVTRGRQCFGLSRERTLLFPVHLCTNCRFYLSPTFHPLPTVGGGVGGGRGREEKRKEEGGGEERKGKRKERKEGKKKEKGRGMPLLADLVLYLCLALTFSKRQEKRSFNFLFSISHIKLPIWCLKISPTFIIPKLLYREAVLAS